MATVLTWFAAASPGLEGVMTERSAAPRHHWIVRTTHWVNVVAFTIMVGSGMRTFNAYPAFRRKGEGAFLLWPFEAQPAPAWLTFGTFLANARMWHFAMMWVLVATGLLYLGFIYLHGEWRDLVPRRGDPRGAWKMVRFYTHARKDHPRQGKHNALQRTTYFLMPFVGAAIVLTGLAIWEPDSLGWLTSLFGGYVLARWWHFSAMLALVVMSLVHVFMVISVDPYSLRGMITCRHIDRLSPEARNARPFQNLLPRTTAAAPEAPPP
jgi:thiosulfate reductase cytochrome b subunit